MSGEEFREEDGVPQVLSFFSHFPLPRLLSKQICIVQTVDVPVILMSAEKLVTIAHFRRENDDQVSYPYLLFPLYVEQLADTLSNYVVAYEKYVTYKAAMTEGGPVDGDPVELPDLRLGKTILECCKSCAEQVPISQHSILRGWVSIQNLKLASCNVI
jgi:hypothetical protein